MIRGASRSSPYIARPIASITATPARKGLICWSILTSRTVTSVASDGDLHQDAQDRHTDGPLTHFASPPGEKSGLVTRQVSVAA